jgi:hypothetical protein
MRKIISNIFIIILLFICSTSLISCEAITAQNINIDSASGMKGGTGMMGGPGMNGGPDTNGNARMSEIINADLMGKIISVDGNIVTIELIEQAGNSKSLNSKDSNQNKKNNQNNDNTKSQKGFSRNKLDINYTGIYKTLEVSDDVNISQELSMGHQNNDSKSSMKISDLKKDQIIMIWYKENTSTVEKISVLKF